MDGLVYQDLADLEHSLRELNPNFSMFESSCFNGQYVTGDIDEAYLDRLVQEQEIVKQQKQQASLDD